MEAVQPNTPIYTGEFYPVLDEKKRLTIPSRLRQAGDSEEFYVLPSPTRPCLMVMLAPVLKQIGTDSEQHAKSRSDHRLFLRNLYSQVRSAATDRQGRLLLSDDHCKRAKLSGEVALVGAGDWFEIWSKEEWRQTCATEKLTFEEVSRAFGL